MRREGKCMYINLFLIKGNSQGATLEFPLRHQRKLTENEVKILFHLFSTTAMPLHVHRKEKNWIEIILRLEMLRNHKKGHYFLFTA